MGGSFVNKILIVSDCEKNTKALSSLCKNLGYDCENVCLSDEEMVYSKILSSSFSLAIVFDADVLCINLKKKSDIDILCLLNKSSIKEKSAQLSSLGIFTLAFPFEEWELVQAINFINASHSRFDSLKKEKDGLVKKVEDMKIIDRAKCCLIHYLRITEATAHRHIEKQAMDMRLTKRQVAEEILKKYEA